MLIAVKRIALHFAVCSILLLGLANAPAQAQRVALLPMADFSQGVNGINLPFTQVVANSLQRLGVEMVPQDQVVKFMSANKLRSFSYLDSFLIKKIGKDLSCVVALLGTITEIGGDNPQLGLTFTALDTVTGMPIWSETGATSLAEKVTFLALGQPQTIDDLSGPLLDQLLLRLEGQVAETGVPDRRDYQLTGMQLFPAYVKGRQQIDATLKIRFLDARPTRIFAESKAGRSLLQANPRTGIYSGKWFAPEQEGQYPIDLILEWGSGRFAERVENIASYQVINNPPGLTIELKNGQQIDGRRVFRDSLLLLPRIADLKPMGRWGLEIRNEDGLLLVSNEYEGDMPERLVWEGHGADGFYLADGPYEITLQVWDLAGNRSSATRQVVMQRNAPLVEARVSQRAGKYFLSLNEVSAEFSLRSWQAQLKSGQGKILLQVDGERLPTETEFKPLGDENAVYLSFDGVDELGNRRRIARKELLMKVEQQAVEEQEAESWVPDF